MNRKLGKQPKRHDRRTLKMAKYLASGITAPAAVDYTHGVTDFGMFLNDKLGCCTIAGVGHAVQVWTLNALGREANVTDNDVLAYYESWDGYNPKDPSTDNGGIELNVLTNWRQQGFAGHGIDAFVAVDLEPHHLRLATWLFGGIYVGVELPVRADGQDVWDVPSVLTPDDDAGSWGGHCVVCPKFDEEFLTCITWGKLRRMTWPWVQRYMSEAYALVSPEWLAPSGKAPSGFDRSTLLSDLSLVTA